MKEILINHFLNYEFLYIFLFCSISFFIISIFIKNSITRKVLILFFSIFFTLFLFEFGLFFFMDQYNWVPDYTKFFEVSRKYDIVKQREILLFNEKKNILHRIITKENDNNEENNIEKKYIGKGYKKIYDTFFSVYLNGLGLLRYTKSNSNGDKIYVFLGCSFTFGSCLEDTQTLPYYFSMLNKFESNVINFGRCGKGTNYALNVLNSDLLDDFTGKVKMSFFMVL